MDDQSLCQLQLQGKGPGQEKQQHVGQQPLHLSAACQATDDDEDALGLAGDAPGQAAGNRLGVKRTQMAHAGGAGMSESLIAVWVH